MTHDGNAQLGELLGKRLKDRFELLGVIGRGGMGAVFSGWDHQFASPVAIKVILPSLQTNEALRRDLTARFRREARNSFQLKHQNIVTVTDFGEDPEHQMLFLVMEQLTGKDLESELRTECRIAPRRAVHILAQVCAAIDFAHQAGQIHRDLKPSNVMLIRRDKDNDFVKVLDFGLARHVKGEDRLTETGMVYGTAQYMAPEQIDSHLPLDARCDIYALGAVAYHLLSGQVPFTGATVTAILLAQKTERQTPLCEIVPGLPKALSDAVDRALQKRPEARYSTMEDFRDALESAVRGTDEGRPRVSTPAIGVPPQPGSPVGTPPQPVPAYGPPTGPQAGPTTPGGGSTPSVPKPSDRLRLAARRTVALSSPHAGVIPARRATVVAIDDGAAVLYEHPSAGTSHLACQLLRPDLAAASPAVLTRAPSIALAPAATAGHGGVLVAWVDVRTRNGASQIHAGTWRLEHSASLEAVPLGDATWRAAEPTIATTPHGAIVAWHEVLRGGSRVALALVDASCRPTHTLRAAHAACPTLASSGDGALVAWHERSQPGAPRAIRLCSIALPHGQISAPLRWEHCDNAAFPVLAADDNGGFAMMWWAGGPTPAAMLSRVARDGTPLGEPVRLGAASHAPRRGSLIAVAGGWVASWIEPMRGGVVATWLPNTLSCPPREPIAIDVANPSGASLARFGDGAVAVWSAPGTGWAASLNVTQLSLTGGA